MSWYKKAKSLEKETIQKESKTGSCWKGYKRVGMKKKGKRWVPNCVPKS